MSKYFEAKAYPSTFKYFKAIIVCIKWCIKSCILIGMDSAKFSPYLK